MKKIVLGLLAVASLSFGFEEYYSFVNQIKENLSKRNDLFIGSIIEPNSSAVVGFAGCDQQGYFININTVNTYRSNKSNIIKVRTGFEKQDKMCDILNSATNIGTIPSVVDDKGNTHEYGTEYYNHGEGCVAQYLEVTGKSGEMVPVTNLVCYGVNPLNPLAKKPELVKYTGGKPAEYFRENYNKILAWNDKNSDAINALFLDDESDLRDAYTTKEILDVALKAGVMGVSVDQSGVLLYILDTDDNNKPVIYIGDKKISITNEMLDKAPALKASYEAYIGNTPAKYVVGCEDSIALAEGTEGVPTQYIYGIVNGQKFIKYPILNNNAKLAFPYLCNAKMEGNEFTKEQYFLLREAGLLLSKPVVIDENKKKEIDDNDTVAKPAAKDNSPKGKVISLLKTADMPGVKMDEKGRYLGEVSTYGKGTAIITLPNNEEFEYNIPVDSSLNILGKDVADAVRDLDNQVYVYGCDIPLVEKPGKNTPEIGVIYVVYNGHAVSSVPAYINGSFKCNKKMVNKEISQADYFKMDDLSRSKMKQHPAFK
jgi:hypothetical protein|nr:MAG TPA: hypothetical protein [Caudoviricetes sp.]